MSFKPLEEPASVSKANAERLRANGQVDVFRTIRKMHGTRPQFQEGTWDDLIKSAGQMEVTADDSVEEQTDNNYRASFEEIKKTLSSAPMGSGPHFDPKFGIAEHVPDPRKTVGAIRKAQGNPVTWDELTHGGGKTEIDVADLERIAARHSGRMRKRGAPNIVFTPDGPMVKVRKSFGNRFVGDVSSFPRESNNSEWVDADYTRAGASHDRSTFADEGTQRPTMSHLGGYSDSNLGPKDYRVQAAVIEVDEYARHNMVDVEGREDAVAKIKAAQRRPMRW